MIATKREQSMANKYEPVFNLAGFERIQNELGRIFNGDNLDLGEIFNAATNDGPEHSYRPRADMWETDHEYVIEVDLPGVDPDLVDVSVQHGCLTISGSRVTLDRPVPDSSLESEMSANPVRRECRSGEFRRRFSLPESADTERVSATGRHGALVIRIGKRPNTGARTIKVSQQ